MRHEAQIPPQFASLTGNIHYVQQVTPTEYSASCPKCGGDVHPGGEWPDRFRMFLDGGNPRAWCRRCSYFAWADETDENKPAPTNAEIDKWRQEQIKREQARRRSTDLALANLRDNAIWERYYDQNDASGQAYWVARGVPQAWQSFWQLGFVRDRSFVDVVSDAATIPIFGYEREIQQVKYRLLNEEHGRYRYHLSGTTAPAFLCNPDAALGGHVYAIEGEIKSMVTFAALDDSNCSMMGLPGTNPGERIIHQLRQADKVTLVFDPDAKRDAIKLARQIGIHKTWILIPPVKIDDGIIEQRLNKRDVEHILGTAIKLDHYVTA